MTHDWDLEADVVVLGTGAGGLLAALAAQAEGASVCVLEKSEFIGGTTALSGGVIWFPNNHRELEAGIEDDPELAIDYIETIADGRSSRDLIETYVRRGPEMLKWVEANTSIEFACIPSYPDYHPELKGGKAGGRSLDNGLFDTKLLGEWQPKLRPNPVNGKMPIAIPEAVEWGVFFNPLGFDFKKVMERAKQGIVHGGAGLIGKLLLACVERGIEPMTEAAGKDLITDESGRVVGVIAETPTGSLKVRAQKGVIMAMGGFEWADDLVKAFLPLHMKHPVSPPHNTGDGLRMAMKLGCELGNMPEAWWTPCVLLPGEVYDGAPLHRSEFSVRCLPHSIIVNRHGKRFTNEAGNYNDMTKPWFEHDPARYEQPNVPSWLVVDSQYMSKYMMVTATPGYPVPDYIERAESLEELASKLGIDEAGLRETVERFNGFVAEGEDKDFLRGWSKFDQYYGDPRMEKNPNLGTLEEGPFFALEIHPGTMGTKGGPKTTVDAEVKKVGGETIPGLYAVGNTAAGLGGAGYAGAGITIGTSMLMGWLAGRHAASS